VQAREREARLRRRTRGSQHPQVGGLPGGVRQQRRLAYAGLAAQHKAPAAAPAGVVEDRVEDGALRCSPVEHEPDRRCTGDPTGDFADTRGIRLSLMF
jgi:hypothetical protein